MTIVGHGVPNALPCINDDPKDAESTLKETNEMIQNDQCLKYTDLIQHIIDSTDKQSKAVDLPDDKLEWDFNLFIDVCHAGSCADRAEEW